MRTITANPVTLRGVERWRVLVPKDLRDGNPKARYFSARAAAESFAADLNHQRGGVVSRFVALPEAVQQAALRAILSLGDEAAHIEDAAALWLAKERNKPKITKLVADAAAACLEAKELAGVSKAYLRELKFTLGSFAGFAVGRHVNEIEASDVAAWLASGEWSNATRRSYLTDVRTLFSYSIKQGWCSVNPAVAIERPQLDERPPGILTPAQAGKLLRTAMKMDTGVATYIAVGMFAGLRPSEALRFKLSDAGSNGHLEVFATKTRSRRRRLVTIQPALARVLRSKNEITRVNFTRRLRRVRRAAGVPMPHDVLRHTFASYHLAQFGSAEKTALEMGHTETGTLFRHYRELVSKSDAEKFWKI